MSCIYSAEKKAFAKLGKKVPAPALASRANTISNVFNVFIM